MEDEQFARFLTTIGRLKRTPRTGWVDRGVSDPESVADHSFRVAVMAWLAAAKDSTLDRDRVLKLALVHDLAEALVGDITPYDRQEVSKLEPEERRRVLSQRQYGDTALREGKHDKERAAMAELVADLAPALGKEILVLWTEMLGRKTPEARFVKQIDVLETYLQSREYLKGDPTPPMDSFSIEVNEVISNPSLRALRDAIHDLTENPLP